MDIYNPRSNLKQKITSVCMDSVERDINYLDGCLFHLDVVAFRKAKP